MLVWKKKSLEELTKRKTVWFLPRMLGWGTGTSVASFPIKY